MSSISTSLLSFPIFLLFLFLSSCKHAVLLVQGEDIYTCADFNATDCTLNNKNISDFECSLWDTGCNCKSNCTLPLGGTLHSCTDHCNCLFFPCEMPVCTSNCYTNAGPNDGKGTAMPLCTQNCTCTAAMCDMSNCQGESSNCACGEFPLDSTLNTCDGDYLRSCDTEGGSTDCTNYCTLYKPFCSAPKCEKACTAYFSDSSISACKENCECHSINCDMSSCTKDCRAHSPGVDMSSCTENCKCDAGGCKMSSCKGDTCYYGPNITTLLLKLLLGILIPVGVIVGLCCCWCGSRRRNRMSRLEQQGQGQGVQHQQVPTQEQVLEAEGKPTFPVTTGME